MITLYGENGELSLIGTSGTFILDTVEETTAGRDIVHARKTTLVLNRRDAVKLRRALGSMLRKPRPRRAAPAMAKECVACSS